jgi:hypothetical protein
VLLLLPTSIVTDIFAPTVVSVVGVKSMSIADYDFRSYLEKIPNWHAPHASLVSKKQGKSNASGSFFSEK